VHLQPVSMHVLHEMCLEMNNLVNTCIIESVSSTNILKGMYN